MADVEAPHHYKFNVKMSCSGCSGAIDRVLKKTEGQLTLLAQENVPLGLCPVP